MSKAKDRRVLWEGEWRSIIDKTRTLPCRLIELNGEFFEEVYIELQRWERNSLTCLIFDATEGYITGPPFPEEIKTLLALEELKR